MRQRGRVCSPQRHPQVRLVGKRQRRALDSIETRNGVLQGRDRVCQCGTRWRWEKTILQQVSVVAAEIHHDLQWYVRVNRILPLSTNVPPLGGRADEPGILELMVFNLLWLEQFRDPFYRSQDGEIIKETRSWWQSRRHQWVIRVHHRKHFLRIELVMASRQVRRGPCPLVHIVQRGHKRRGTGFCPL